MKNWMRMAGLAALLGGPLARAGDIVCFEAETAAAVTRPVTVVTAPAAPADEPVRKEASGQAYIEIAEGAGKPPEVGGDAVWRFSAGEGEYIFWARVWWLDSCGNSLRIIIDGGRPFLFGQDGTYKSWHWVKGMKVKLTAGTHELKIENREDGVKVDQILLAPDADYVPTGIEDTTPPPTP